MEDQLLGKVEKQLARYRHPLFDFSCAKRGEGIELQIKLKPSEIYSNPYKIVLTERDIEDPQFEWAFQRLLYNCLHDYVVEMFEDTPQSR